MKRILILLALAAPSAGFAASARMVADPTAQAECSACHMAYPPALLPKASWDAILSDLSNHFGEDASLDPATLDKIRAYFDSVAPQNVRGVDNADPVLKITDLGWFTRIHGARAKAWAESHPSVATLANCTGCHRGAAQGYFEDE